MKFSQQDHVAADELANYLEGSLDALFCIQEVPHTDVLLLAITKLMAIILTEDDECLHYTVDDLIDLIRTEADDNSLVDEVWVPKNEGPTQ